MFAKQVAVAVLAALLFPGVAANAPAPGGLRHYVNEPIMVNPSHHANQTKSIKYRKLDELVEYAPSTCANREDLEDLSTNQMATSSSTYAKSWRYEAYYINDGDINTFAHTNRDAVNWIKVDLKAGSTVDEVRIFRRRDCCFNRNYDFTVRLLKDGNEVAQYYQEAEMMTPELVVSFCQEEADQVEISMDRHEWMAFGEIIVMGHSEVNDVSCENSAEMENLSTFQPAHQSSLYANNEYYSAIKAVDGNVNTFSHTNGVDSNGQPVNSLTVDLKKGSKVDQVRILRRVNCCPERSREFYVRLLKGGDIVEEKYRGAPMTTDELAVSFCGEEADQVQIFMDRQEWMAFAEIIVEGTADQVEVCPSRDDLVNLSTYQPATASSQYAGSWRYGPDYAFDGNDATFSHSNRDDFNWIRVDLKAGSTVDQVTIVRRKDCCFDRNYAFTVKLLKDEEEVARFYHGALMETAELTIPFCQEEADQVEISMDRKEWMHFAEIEVWGHSQEPVRNCRVNDHLENLSTLQPASQSSTFQNNPNYAASRAFDGNQNTFSHTNYDDINWIKVGLKGGSTVDQVTIIPRANCCYERNARFYVRLLKDGALVTQHYQGAPISDTLVVPFCGEEADQVEIVMERQEWMAFAEIIVQGLSDEVADSCASRGTSPLVDLSTNQYATSSSLYGNSWQWGAYYAVDGDLDTVAATKNEEVNWMEVYLRDGSTVDQVRIFRRNDCCEDKNHGFTVSLLKDDEEVALYYQIPVMQTDELVVSFCGQEADKVKIQMDRREVMAFAEIVVEGRIDQWVGACSNRDDLVDLSTYQPASSSSILSNNHKYAPEQAFDGVLSTFAHTHRDEVNWLKVDLKKDSTVDQVRIFRRTDGYEERNRDFYVRLLKDETVVAEFWQGAPIAAELVVQFCQEEADQLEIEMDRQEWMAFAEIVVEGHSSEVDEHCPSRDNLENLSFNQPATSSSTFANSWRYEPYMLVDGDEDTFAHTNREDFNWFRVDLKAGSTVDQVTIIRRKDCCFNRNYAFTVKLLKDDEEVARYYQGPEMPSELVVQFCGEAADQVEISMDRKEYMHFAEIIVEGISDEDDGSCDNSENMINLSTFQPASLSSTYANNAYYAADKAVDGKLNTFAHTHQTDANGDEINWLRVDLKAGSMVDQVRIFPRSDCCVDRNREFYIRLLKDGDIVKEEYQAAPISDELIVPFCHDAADQVEIFMDRKEWMAFAEVIVEGTADPADVCPNRENMIDLSTNRPSTSSSVYANNWRYGAYYANDGDVSTFAHTHRDDVNWMIVDLRAGSTVDQVTIMRRRDCCFDRNYAFYVTLLKDGEEVARHYQGEEMQEDELVISFCAEEADQVKVSMDRQEWMAFAEIKVEGHSDDVYESCPNRREVLENLSTHQPADESSIYANNPFYAAAKAVDGNFGTNAHTNKDSDGNWMTVDLKIGSTVDQVRLFRRRDCCVDRNREFYIRLLKRGEVVAEQYQGAPVGLELVVSFCGEEADQVEIYMEREEYLSWAEIWVEGDSEEPKVCTANIWGDPHLTTFDGLKYDAQPKGEAVFITQTTTAFRMHGLLQKANPNWHMPAVTKGIAVHGSDVKQPTIQVALVEATPELATETLTAPTGHQCPIQLLVDCEKEDTLSHDSTDDWGAIVENEGNVITVEYPGLLGLTMSVAHWGGSCYFNVDVSLLDCEPAMDTVMGLLGSPNSNALDDWMEPDGTVLDIPHGASAFFFEPAFAYTRDNWMVHDEADSIFCFDGEDQSFDDIHVEDEEYDSDFEDAINNVDDDVKEICGDDLGCLVDGATLGGEAAIQHNQNPANDREMIVAETTAPTSAPTGDATPEPTKSPVTNTRGNFDARDVSLGDDAFAVDDDFLCEEEL